MTGAISAKFREVLRVIPGAEVDLSWFPSYKTEVYRQLRVYVSRAPEEIVEISVWIDIDRKQQPTQIEMVFRLGTSGRLYQEEFARAAAFSAEVSRVIGEATSGNRFCGIPVKDRVSSS